MSPEDAIEQTSSNEPLAVEHDDANDPQGLAAGMEVVVSPDLDGGEQPVQGTLVAATRERIVIKRNDEDAGNLHVHFPRIGYRVSISG